MDSNVNNFSVNSCSSRELSGWLIPSRQTTNSINDFCIAGFSRGRGGRERGKGRKTGGKYGGTSTKSGRELSRKDDILEMA